ncbi:LOW QUALITY PROTEIN: geminin [Synchiropus picturatus]
MRIFKLLARVLQTVAIVLRKLVSVFDWIKKKETMSSSGKTKPSQEKYNENLKNFFGSSQKALGTSAPRPTFKVLQASAVNKNLGKTPQQAGKVVPKRKQWHSEPRGQKRVRVEVKSTQTEDIDSSADGISPEAYNLMVKETPPEAYWKEVAESRRRALFDMLRENETLFKDLEEKEEQIKHLKSENTELQELAQHVKYMADMIERLTGKEPDSLEQLKEITLEEEKQEDCEEGKPFSSDEEFDVERDLCHEPGDTGENDD